MSNPNPFGDENGDTGLGSPYTQIQPNTNVNSEQANGQGQGSYGNNLTVPTGFTDPNGHNVQYGGFAQGMNQANIDAGGQAQTAQQLQQMAQGKGPSVAADLLKQQTANAQANNNAMASSGSGQTGQAAARRTAMMANTQAAQNLGGQASAARAQEQESAIGQLAGLQTNMRSQDVGQAQAFDTAANDQAQLNMGQSQLQQQQGQINFGQGMQISQGAAAAAGAAMMFADGEMQSGKAGARVGQSNFVEPGGGARQTIREEQTVDGEPFTLIVDWQTGKLRKIATLPLSPEEERRALGPHGAGPIDSPNRTKSQMHADGEMQSDGAPPPQQDVSGDARFADMVRRAHPGLYRAATTGPTPGRTMADGEMGWAPPSGGNVAAEQLRDPSYGEADLNADMVRSAYAGRDSGGNEYAVPGYTPPDLSSPRFTNDEAGQQFREDDQQRDLDKLRYDKPMGKEEAQAQKAAAANASPGAAASDDGTHWGKVVGAALAGFGNPKGVTGRMQQPKLSSAKPAAMPMTGGAQSPAQSTSSAPQVAYPSDYAEAFPERQHADGELGAQVRRAYEAADTKIADARRSHEADDGLRELSRMRKSALKDIEYTPEEERPLLAKKRGAPPGSVELATGPEGRTLEGLGYGSFDRVALDDDDRGGKVTIGQIEQHPGTSYPDGELGSRRSFDRDIEGERAILESQRAPVDLDAYVPSADDAYGWQAPENEERQENVDPADVPANFRLTPEEERAHERQTRDIAAMSPYGPERRRPALAAMFSPPPKVGPTDWMTALHESNARYRGLAPEERAWEDDEQANASHEKSAASAQGLDLVPGEAEGISMGEARRRTKLRSSVKDLLAKWESERKRKAQYSDGELGQPDRNVETSDRTRAGNAQADAAAVRRRVDTSESMPVRSYRDADLKQKAGSALAATMRRKRTAA